MRSGCECLLLVKPEQDSCSAYIEPSPLPDLRRTPRADARQAYRLQQGHWPHTWPNPPYLDLRSSTHTARASQPWQCLNDTPSFMQHREAPRSAYWHIAVCAGRYIYRIAPQSVLLVQQSASLLVPCVGCCSARFLFGLIRERQTQNTLCEQRAAWSSPWP